MFERTSNFLLKILDLLPYVAMNGVNGELAKAILTDCESATEQVWKLHGFISKFSYKIQAQLRAKDNNNTGCPH